MQCALTLLVNLDGLSQLERPRAGHFMIGDFFLETAIVTPVNFMRCPKHVVIFVAAVQDQRL